MPFPIEFAKKNGNYDFFSPIINVACNAAVVAVGGFSLGAISYVALKRLGFNEIAATTEAAIPVVIGATGAVVAVVTGGLFIVMINGVANALGRR